MSEKKKELTETEQKIFEAIDKSDVVLLKALLVENQNVNFVDPKHAMTPIQEAAYRGNKDIVQMLLDQGADVNLCEHQYNYTALHFAGLSGSVDVCLALLLAGAKTNVTNTVHRTPSQMAAFVGNHACVAVMNNFVPKSDIECYTIPHGNQEKASLPPHVENSFHKFIMQVNIHPVKVIRDMQKYPGLLEHLLEVQEVLELMSEREMKRGMETNEVMSFKFHYLSFIVREVKKAQANVKSEDIKDGKKPDYIELCIRKLLKPGKDGVLEMMDAFLRECVREFPFRDSTLLRQMVATLASKDPPSALNVVSSAINGQRGFYDSSICYTCGEDKPEKKCSKCKVVQYCDRNCQRLHWHWHKKVCAKLSQTVVETENKPAPNPEEISQELQNVFLN